MRVFGIIISILGFSILAYAFTMDTTVTYLSGMERFGKEGFNPEFKSVHNIGLMEQKQSFLMIGGLAVVVGILLIGFSRRNTGSIDASEKEKLKINWFEGETDISQPSYQLFLVRAYDIEKNNALNKYVLGEQVFDTLDEALFQANIAYQNELENENQKLIKEEADKLAKEKYVQELNKEGREKMERLAPVLKKISKFIGMGVFLLSGIAIYNAIIDAKEREANEAAKQLAEKIRKEKSEEEERLAEEKRKLITEKVKEELLLIFSTGSFHGFKIGENNLESLSKMTDYKSPKKGWRYNDTEFYLECRPWECKNLFKDASISKDFESVEFSFCTPGAKESRNLKSYKMTGFKITFGKLPQMKVYSEYLASYKDLPSPPSNVDQEFRSNTAELSLKWNKKRRDYLEENKDICGNNKGHLS